MADFNIGNAVKLWFFVIALSFFVIIGSVAVHEIGHGLVGAAFGCEVESVVLYSPGESPGANIRCDDDFSHIFVALAGISFNILFGILFLFSETPLMNKVAYMFFGFGLYSAKMDLQSVGFPVLIGSLVSLVGVFLIMYAIYLLCEFNVSKLFETKQGVPS
ncbi:MAG: M50 family metallopeptidase [Nanoarchaeota archaeon]|nr:M50 family metallopeptidase [Nanoarchaeota archaeon]